MAGKRNDERDERVKLPFDPETALHALLAVDPEDEAAEGKLEPEAVTDQETSAARHAGGRRKSRGKHRG